MKRKTFPVLFFAGLSTLVQAATIPSEFARDIALKNWKMNGKCNGWGSTHEVDTVMDYNGRSFRMIINMYEVMNSRRYLHSVEVMDISETTLISPGFLDYGKYPAAFSFQIEFDPETFKIKRFDQIYAAEGPGTGPSCVF